MRVAPLELWKRDCRYEIVLKRSRCMFAGEVSKECKKNCKKKKQKKDGGLTPCFFYFFVAHRGIEPLFQE